MSNDQILDRSLTRLWFVWGALLASLIIYLLIAQWVGPLVDAATHSEGSGKATWLLYTVALLVFLFAGIIRKALLQGTAAVNRMALLNRYQLAVIVSAAFCESVAIIGLVVYFLGMPQQTVFTLILLSAAAMMIYRPQRSELEQLLHRSQ